MFQNQPRLSITLTALLCCLLLTPTSVAFAKEKMHKEQREISEFSCVDVQGAGHLHLKQGAQESLTIETTLQDPGAIISEVKRGCLALRIKPQTETNGEEIHYYLTVNDLKMLQTAGAIAVLSKNTLTTPKLDLTTQGASQVKLKIKSEQVQTKIEGSSQVILEGSAKKQEVMIQGSGQFQGKKLSTNAATVFIQGSGQAIVRALKSLNVTIQGSGIVKFYGNPVIEQQVSGSGEIVPL